MGSYHPHLHRKIRRSQQQHLPTPVENEVERLTKIAQKREARQRLEEERLARMAARRAKREANAKLFQEYRVRMAVAEDLAQQAFPWNAIKRQKAMLDRLIRFSNAFLGNQLQQRGLLWACYLLFGRAGVKAVTKIDRHVHLDEAHWRAACDLCPLTTEATKLSKVADFLEAVTWTMTPVPEWPERPDFRVFAHRAAKQARESISARLEDALANRGGLTFQDIGDGWFGIRDESLTRTVWEMCGRPFGTYELACATRSGVRDVRKWPREDRK